MSGKKRLTEKLVWNSFAQGTRNLAIVYSHIRALREGVCQERSPRQHKPVLEGYRGNAQKSAHVFLDPSLLECFRETAQSAVSTSRD
jgi:hypothetical protein